MTIAIQKSETNLFSLTDILALSIYANRTYKFKFTSGTSKVEQTLVLVPSVVGDRFNFTLIEGTDITFEQIGFYKWQLYEVEDTILAPENLLCEGKMKVFDLRTEPATPTVLNGQTYAVYNG